MSADLNISQGLRADQKAQIRLLFGAEVGGQAVRGIQKAVHRFLTIFLTERGTVLRDPQRGTEFMRALRSGLIRTDSDVYLYFNLSADQAGTYLEDQTGPPSERFGSAELDWFDLDAGRLLLGIRIRTESDEAVDIILPTTELSHA